ncbi:hypothetical protein [Lyngbya confervoides]|uniref:Uncharacterized protein n=1 Tax=Lyngbya confervoides BDU141951 TaxID=1574623 RepID=A0ABD4T0X9_9CYAN|nr:hypothetical protein [Lyngbya confervoides]MCM1981957.1 hypothetical protein [Lyngbya confervoides BDU141951]
MQAQLFTLPQPVPIHQPHLQRMPLTPPPLDRDRVDATLLEGASEICGAALDRSVEQVVQ